MVVVLDLAGAREDMAAPIRADLPHPPALQVRLHGAQRLRSRIIRIGRRGSAPVAVPGRRAVGAVLTRPNAAARSITKARDTAGPPRADSAEAATSEAPRSPPPADRPSIRSDEAAQHLVLVETPWGDGLALPQPQARPEPGRQRRAAASLQDLAERWPADRVSLSDRMGPSLGAPAPRSGHTARLPGGPELPSHRTERTTARRAPSADRGPMCARVASLTTVASRRPGTRNIPARGMPRLGASPQLGGLRPGEPFRRMAAIPKSR